MPTTYPQAGTKADAILGFIRDNPGATTNAIITGLGFNPSTVHRYVKVLIEHQLVVDKPNQQGWHQYYLRDIEIHLEPGVYQMELEIR